MAPQPARQATGGPWSPTRPTHCARPRKASRSAATQAQARSRRAPDALFAQLKTMFDDGEILELTYVTCLYGIHAVMSKALRTEGDDRDDPIVEVASTEGFPARDFLDIGRR